MTTINTTKLGALLKKHASTEPTPVPEPVSGKDPIHSLAFAFLLWEATTTEAVEAWMRVREAIVDDNDLRISLPFEIVELLGPKYPRAMERSERMRASLNDIYRREHSVSLARLAPMGKREQRAYIESLEGMAPFVAARTLLVCYGVHGVPIDERICAALADGGAVEAGTDPVELGSVLGRQVKAEQAEAFHLALLTVADAAAGQPRGATTRKTTRKTTPRKGRAGKSGSGA